MVNANEANVFPISRGTIAFQVLLIFASWYYPMLISIWGDATLSRNEDMSDYYEANRASFWVKLVGEWGSMLIFTFALVAPKVLNGREFY
jgi:hypothetical protein